MTTVVESSQWTGEYDDAPLGNPIVWGEFPNCETLDGVAARLQSEPWFHDTTARTEAGKHGLADNDYFGHDEWAAFTPGLKTVEEAISIRRRVLLAFERAET